MIRRWRSELRQGKEVASYRTPRTRLWSAQACLRLDLRQLAAAAPPVKAGGLHGRVSEIRRTGTRNCAELPELMVWKTRFPAEIESNQNRKNKGRDGFDAGDLLGRLPGAMSPGNGRDSVKRVGLAGEIFDVTVIAGE